jgi:hypothetical protein
LGARKSGEVNKKQLIVALAKGLKINKKQIVVLWVGITLLLPILFYWLVAYNDYKVEKRNLDFAAIKELAKLTTERDFNERDIDDLTIEAEELRKELEGQEYLEWYRDQRAELVKEHGEKAIQEWEQNRQKRKEEIMERINVTKRLVGSRERLNQIKQELEKKSDKAKVYSKKIKEIFYIMKSFYTSKFTTSAEFNKALDRKNKKAITIIAMPILIISYLSLLLLFLYLTRNS